MQIKDFPKNNFRNPSDLLLIQEAVSNNYKHISVEDFLSGSGSGIGGSSQPWQLKSSNYVCLSGERIIADTTANSWILTLPMNPLLGTEIELLLLSSVTPKDLLIEGLSIFESKQVVRLKASSRLRSVKLVYINTSVGWVQNPVLLTPVYPSVNLTYVSDGDTNGVFHYIGTNRNTELWTNPYTANRIGIFYSTWLSNQDTIQSLVDRQPSAFHTNTESNPFIGFDLQSTRGLILNKWSYRSRSNSTLYLPNRIIVSASNDGTAYTQLDDKSLSTAQNTWYSYSVLNQTVSYRYFKFTYPANSYFTAGEFELYGNLINIS